MSKKPTIHFKDKQATLLAIQLVGGKILLYEDNFTRIYWNVMLEAESTAHRTKADNSGRAYVDSEAILIAGLTMPIKIYDDGSFEIKANQRSKNANKLISVIGQLKLKEHICRPGNFNGKRICPQCHKDFGRVQLN